MDSAIANWEIARIVFKLISIFKNLLKIILWAVEDIGRNSTSVLRNKRRVNLVK
jgi:hypothetical protein